MGAGASASCESKSSGNILVTTTTKDQEEEAKFFYMNRIAEVMAKEFKTLQSKSDASQAELQHEVLRLLQKHEHFILEKNLHPLNKKHPNFSSSLLKKSAIRRSFDNLAFEEHMPVEGTVIYSPTSSRRLLTSFEDGESEQRRGGGSPTSSMTFLSESNSGEFSSHSNGNAEKKFRMRCLASAKHITSKRSLTHMAAVDGSLGGDMAFQTMMQMKKKLDHVCVFHAYNKDISHKLQPDFHPDAVRSRYENELITKCHLPTSKFTFYWEDQKERDIKKVIEEMLCGYRGGVKNPMRPTRNEPNFFFCGHSGIEGDRAGHSTLGSVTDIALRSVHMPVIICKNLCTSDTRFFLIAVDGSRNSQHGFEIAMALVKPKDRVQCVTITKNHPLTSPFGDKMEGHGEDINDFYTSELSCYGPANSDFVSLPCPDGLTVAECLVDYSDSVEADFFAISPRADLVLTSVTEYVITKAKASIILCKN